MTRQEAINHLKNDWFRSLGGQLCVDGDKIDNFLEAVGMGIKELSIPESSNQAQIEKEKNESITLQDIWIAHKIEQCRKCAYFDGGDMGKCIPRMTSQAADILSELWAENNRLRMERNAAIDDLRQLVNQYCPCYACKNDIFDYDKSRCTGCPYNNWDNWEWRGLKEK